MRDRKLDLVHLAHKVAHLRDIFWALVAGLRNEVYKLADDSGKAIHAMHNDLKLLPILGVVLRDLRSMQQHSREVAEMPTAFFAYCSVPMLMVAEGTGAAIGSTDAVESGVAMIALDGIRRLARRRRSYGARADASEVLISGR